MGEVWIIEFVSIWLEQSYVLTQMKWSLYLFAKQPSQRTFQTPDVAFNDKEDSQGNAFQWVGIKNSTVSEDEERVQGECYPPYNEHVDPLRVGHQRVCFWSVELHLPDDSFLDFQILQVLQKIIALCRDLIQVTLQVVSFYHMIEIFFVFYCSYFIFQTFQLSFILIL